MIRARLVRELALKILFAWDSAGESDERTAMQITMDGESQDATARMRAMEIAQKTWDYRTTADAWIERVAPQWPPRRQPAVDRNILRLALYELTADKTPPKVVLDEAIELAKEYSTENSPGFINGVLDAVFKEIKGLTTG